MVGGLLSGTDETPGEVIKQIDVHGITLYKKYRGSASRESYEVQGKVADHRAPEGEATLVQYKGKVETVIQNLMGGLRSGMSYVGATTVKELQERVQFVLVTDSGKKESQAHAKE
jgi:IMP dehydrogenase